MVDPLVPGLSHSFSAGGSGQGLASSGDHAARDVAVARAVARAVRSVPGVAGLARGHSVLAATYGPLQRVTGVVLRRHSQTPGDVRNDEKIQVSPDEIRIEVHVILEATFFPSPSSVETASAQAAEPSNTDAELTDEDGTPGLLPAIAAQIRATVQTAVQNMGLPASVAVDVYIDDLD